MDPLCAVGCASDLDTLPTVKFSESCPEVNQGEIVAIFLGLPGIGFNDWLLPAEWAGRLAPAVGAEDTKLTKLTVIGDKPKPSANQIDISGGRKVTMPKDHVVNFQIDETNKENHEAIRKMQCGGQFNAWYLTSGGLMFGGSDGIGVSLEADMLIPRERGSLIVYEGTLSWKSKYTEERIVSPIS